MATHYPLRSATALLFFYASSASAQYGNGGYSGSSGNNGSPSTTHGGSSYSNSSITRAMTLITAHAVLATLAFGLLFPLGGILIRVASFRGVWLAHGALQAVATILYIAAFGLGIQVATSLRVLSDPHAIIGIVLLILLLLQPASGYLHHVAFVKRGARGAWSYAHVWLGRIAITLGIVNGGLGLRLARKTRFDAPPEAAVVAYAVLAAVMWLVYVAAAVYGERKRKVARAKGADERVLAAREMEDTRAQYA